MLPPYGPPGNGSVTEVTGTSPISVATGTTTPAVSLGTVPVNKGGTNATDAATARSNLAALSSAASAVGATNLAPAIGWGGFVLGRVGAGAVTLTGAKVGDKLFSAVNLAAGPGQGLDRTSYFESTITVADQIQQTSGANTSAEAIQFLLIRSGT